MNEQRDEPEKRPRLNLTTSQVAASALAACCASVVASYLGVAGTVIGAAVGSVVATIGAAVYGHLFRRGSARLRESLQINGRIAEGAAGTSGAGGADGAGPDPVAAPDGRPVPAARGRFYSAPDAPTARDETRVAAPGGGTTGKLWLPASGEPTLLAGTRVDDGRDPASGTAAQDDAAARAPRVGSAAAVRRFQRYRKPIGVAAAIVAVFCVSITAGFLLGGPVRSVGSSSAPPAATAATPGTGARGGAGGGRTAATDPSPSVTATPSASADGTPSPSAAASSTSSTPSASPSATAGATGTGAAATPTGPQQTGPTSTASNTP